MKLKPLLMIGVSLATLALLLSMLNWQKTLDLLRGADALWLIAAFLTSLAAQIVAGWRLQEVLRTLRRDIPLPTALRIHFIGLWSNQLLPGGLGGDAVRIIMLKRRTGLGRAVRGVLLDRIYGLAFLVAAALLALPVTWALLTAPSLRLMALLVTLGGAMGMGTALMLANWPPLEKLMPKRLRFLILVLRDFRRVASRRASPGLVVSSILFLALSILIYWLGARALGVAAGIVPVFAFVPLIFIVMQIPVSYGGWGPREAATIALFAAIGVPHEQAFALALLFGLILTITAVPGVLLLARAHNQEKSERTHHGRSGK